MQKMEVKKSKKSYTHYEADFKEELLRMLNSGESVDEISKTFGISRNVLYTWKSKSQMNAKTKTSEEQTTYSLKLISENEQLNKDNARLQSERDILKKARQALLLVLFSTSS
jgi:transposase